jgi:hypothetical protein
MRGQAVGLASNLLRTDAKKICDARLVFVPRSGMDSAKSLSSRTMNAAAKASPNINRPPVDVSPVNGLAMDSIVPRAASTAAVRFSIDPPSRTITPSSAISYQFSPEDAAIQALDLFRFPSI